MPVAKFCGLSDGTVKKKFNVTVSLSFIGLVNCVFLWQSKGCVCLGQRKTSFDGVHI